MGKSRKSKVAGNGLQGHKWEAGHVCNSGSTYSEGGKAKALPYVRVSIGFSQSISKYITGQNWFSLAINYAHKI